MGVRIEQGAPSEIGLALLPLKEVGEQIAANMLTSGTGKRCGGCGEPFNTARKWRGVARVTHLGESGLLLSTWLVCGKCNHAAKGNGGKVPIELRQEARESYEALRLMQARPEGCA